MSHHGCKVAIVACASAALLTSALAFAGCASQSQEQLPKSHLNQMNQVADSHERCGACHRNATRGNGYYETLDYMGTESLPLSEFDSETDESVTVPAESLSTETLSKEGTNG